MITFIGRRCHGGKKKHSAGMRAKLNPAVLAVFSKDLIGGEQERGVRRKHHYGAQTATTGYCWDLITLGYCLICLAPLQLRKEGSARARVSGSSARRRGRASPVKFI